MRKVIGQADRAIAVAPIPWRRIGQKGSTSFSRRSDEALRIVDAGSPSIRILPRCIRARYRPMFSWPIRTSQVRCATCNAIESARSVNRSAPCTFGRCGTWPRAFRRRDQRKSTTRPTRVIVHFWSTDIWPPPMHSRAKWTRRRPPWRRLAASIPNSPSKSLQSIAPNIPSLVRRLAQGGAAGRMSETRKIAAILVADIVGYSRLAGADEDPRSRGCGRFAPTSSINDRRTTGAWPCCQTLAFCARDRPASPLKRRSRPSTTAAQRPAGLDPLQTSLVASA